MTTGEMGRWCADGKLVRRGHGVYKVARWVPTPLGPFAEAVALMGDGSFLWGESVLSMHGLALVDPRFGVRGDAEARAAQAARLGKSRARAQRRVDDVLRGHTLPARRRRHQGVRGVRHGRAPCRSGETCARRGARHLWRIREPDEGAAMKEAKRPNSRCNLDIAIDRLCASTGDEPGRVKRLLATAIYMLGSLAGSSYRGNSCEIGCTVFIGLCVDKGTAFFGGGPGPHASRSRTQTHRP